MNRIKRSLCAFMAVILTLTMAITACSKNPAENGGPRSDTQSSAYEVYTAATKEEEEAQKAFDEFTDGIFKELMESDTISLHYTITDPEAYGITRPEPSFGEQNLEGLKESLEESKSWLVTLSGIDKNLLRPDQQLTYDIFFSELETELKSEGMELYYQPLSPTTGYQAQLPVLLAEYVFYTEQDIKDYLNLLSVIDESFANILEFEQQKADAGLFISDSAVDRILEGCNSLIRNPEDNYMLEVFDDRIDAFDSLDAQAKEDYKAQNRQIVAEHFIPAYQNLINGLTALKGTGKNELGLAGFPEGKAYYEYLVESNTGSGHTIAELKTMIQEQLETSLGTMAQVMQSNPDVLNLTDNYTFCETEPEKILEQLKTQITENFPPLPETTYTVKYVHPSLQESLSPAFYLVPPIDHYNDNVIYINGSDQYKNSDLYTTLAHEGYPGHLYQNVYFSSVNKSLLRNAINYGGYSEGWATYVEYLSYEFDNGLDPDLGKFLAANASASLAIYAYIDIAVNYDGWTPEQTGAFLEEYYGIKDQDVINSIFYAMVDEPANYLQYYVGYLEISQLKKLAQKTMMFRYSDLEFHTMLLNIGPAPFPIIEEYMMKQMKKK